ncbi:hypothetical protein [Methanococcoides sp. AM1]|uniref:hypothetical protein n=1 Tax=Methanococcoides sp. AM1 TaxID=1201011 RepID=UPI001082E962|nr:hypothetical protein [Methanococcoides sp. AM1]
MSEIAYGKRNTAAIKRRSIVNFFYIGFRKVFQILTKNNNRQVNKIMTYPSIQSRDELADFLNRLAWGFPNKDGLDLKVSVTKELKDIDISKLKPPSTQRNYLKDSIYIDLVSPDETKMSEADLILITKSSSLLDLSILLNLNKTIVADKQYFSLEESNVWKSGFYKAFTQSELLEFESLSKRNYINLLQKNKHNTKAYCFATGPSFDRYGDFDFEEKSFKVICNSTVKNEKFLKHIKKPDLLVFADPVFHFSPCEYSACFRDDVLAVVEKYKCFVMVPHVTVPLLLAHYPELTDYLIGMPVGSKFNFPTPENYVLKGSSNILTLFMLPVASAIANEIFIIGADGRNPDEKYFWKHSSSAQYSDLMQTAFETHPSFFRDRDYKDYYEEHCLFLEKLVEYGESLGKKYISLTLSFIPALGKRQK